MINQSHFSIGASNKLRSIRSKYSSNIVPYLILTLFIQLEIPEKVFAAETTATQKESTFSSPSTKGGPASGADPDKSTHDPQKDQKADSEFLQKFPQLQQYIYKEPSSHFYQGISGVPVGFLKDRVMFAVNFFQIHYLTSDWDYELFSVTFGTTTTKPSYVQSDHFIFRTFPKYRINETWSIGVLAGFEYVSFGKISSKLYKNGWETPEEGFSSKGVIWGGGLTQTYSLESGNKFRVSEVAFKQTYSTTSADHGWAYLYSNQSLRQDTTPIDAGMVIMIELGILY